MTESYQKLLEKEPPMELCTPLEAFVFGGLSYGRNKGKA
jgi:hypothetical protein